MTSRLARAALRYAEKGWHVFPLAPKTKEPIAKSHGFKDASVDLEVVEHWWRRTTDANIGIATGKLSGILVIDIDGPVGEESWAELRQDDIEADHTLSQRTGDGRHLVYRWPGFECRGSNVDSSLKELHLRADAHYIVAPPSIHPSGRQYQWLRDHVTIRECPPWLTECLRERPRPERAARPIERRDGRGEADRAVRVASQWLSIAGDGERHHSRRRAGFLVGKAVGAGLLDYEAAISDLVAISMENSTLSREKIEKTIRYFVDAGMKEEWE